MSLYCLARLSPQTPGVARWRRDEVSHVVMGVVMVAMLLPPFTSSRAPWTVAAAGFAGFAALRALSVLRTRGSLQDHLPHVAMLATMAFMLVTMPPLRGAVGGPHAAHLRAAQQQVSAGGGAWSLLSLSTLVSFAALFGLACERAATVAVLRSTAYRPAPAGSGRWATLLRHPAGLPGCDAVMCAVMAAMLAPML